MQTIRCHFFCADDVQVENQEAQSQLKTVAIAYQDRLKLVASQPFASDIPAHEAPDVVAIVAWNQLTETQARRILMHLQSITPGPKIMIFKKTANVALNLAHREDILARLELKERLESFLAQRAFRNATAHLFDHVNSFSTRFSEALTSYCDQQLGVTSKPLRFRPQASSLYLERPRLLELLPDSVGHVVWLEAPYGYGKSILAAQWASKLEADDWRIVWVVRDQDHHDLKHAIALALGLSPDTPPLMLRQRLWDVTSLLVIEDLRGDEDLDFVLQDNQGLVLLASRDVLQSDNLSELMAQAKVVHLNANQLAFTLAETTRLTNDEETAAQLQQQTLGWSLPLHFFFLSGTLPEPDALLAGIHASLEEEAWQEMLLLAALPYLPHWSANPSTHVLVSKGFVQALESTFRLHPYLAERLVDRFSQQVNQALEHNADRLSLLLRGEAYARCHNLAGVRSVLAQTDAELWRQAPTKLIAWDHLLGDTGEAHIHWAVGAAQARLGDMTLAVQRLERALATPELTPQERMGIMRDLCQPLAVTNHEKALELVGTARPLLDSVDKVLAGRFLANSALVYVYSNHFEQAIKASEEALSYYPASSPYRVGAETNLALFRWNLYGDFSHRLTTQIKLLEDVNQLYPVQALGQCRDIATMYLWLGNSSQARDYFERARDNEDINPAIAIEARAALAYLDDDATALVDVCESARHFSDRHVPDIVPMYKILRDITQQRWSSATATFESSRKGIFASSAYARALAAQGKHAEALALLDSFDQEIDVGNKLYLDAARFLVTGDDKALDDFLQRTTAGSRLLPGFIPLSSLPDQPALAQHYPIETVLTSGRHDAIKLRLADIPELQVVLFGSIGVSFLGQQLELTDRQKQILTLLTLGLSREQIAEAMWPNVTTKKQRNNLNVQLNSLRKVIEPWGVSSYLYEDGLRNVHSDYAALQQALETGNAAKILELYQEPFAPGLDLATVSDERERLRQDIVELLFSASDRDNMTTARAYLLKVIELEPLHEEALQALLKLLIQQGRRREARQLYSVFVTQLKDELDLEPLEATQALIQPS